MKKRIDLMQMKKLITSYPPHKENGVKSKNLVQRIDVSSQQVSNWISMGKYPTYEKTFR
ncbi:UNVERIFIED_ORG: hypothetical protein QFZ59_003668 [Bacillus sp. B2I3]|nr:hypothetical protein [Bacillus sp. B2I3]